MNTTEGLACARPAHNAPLPGYAGDVTPIEAWELISTGRAELVDIRTAEERRFVGLVPGAVHVPWMTGLSFTRNPRFLQDLARQARKDSVLLLICSSGGRSVTAAHEAARGGFRHAYNVVDGFDGALDANHQRGKLSGWRFHGLPWTQQ